MFGFFFGAISSCPLYLLWRTPPQEDAVPIWAKNVENEKFYF
jgi:hypothetical protein